MDPGDRVVMIVSQTAPLLLTITINYQTTLYFEISQGYSSMNFTQIRILGNINVTMVDLIEPGITCKQYYVRVILFGNKIFYKMSNIYSHQINFPMYTGNRPSFPVGTVISYKCSNPDHLFHYNLYLANPVLPLVCVDTGFFTLPPVWPHCIPCTAVPTTELITNEIMIINTCTANFSLLQSERTPSPRGLLVSLETIARQRVSIDL